MSNILPLGGSFLSDYFVKCLIAFDKASMWMHKFVLG